MSRFLVIVIVLLISSCSAQDYSVNGSTTQIFNAEKIKYLIIECYCNNKIYVKETQTEKIKIQIKGKLESVGYHGDQEAPKKIAEETLSFKAEMKKDTLRLVSKEWTYLHHSYLIEELKIQVPKGIKYEIMKIPQEQLEGREIK